MSITSTSTAAEVLAQYNDNLLWHQSTSKAENALEAIRWLLVNRGQAMAVAGRSLNFADLESTAKKIESFLGAGGPRSLGRSRVNRVDFLEPQGVD